MDDMVIQYLPEAFAFIYVANSSLGGGVQKDKVSTSRVCVYFTEIPFEKTSVLSSYFFMQIYLDAFFCVWHTTYLTYMHITGLSTLARFH